MKAAKYKYVGNPTGSREETIIGQVILKSDGKASVSIQSYRREHSHAAKYQAKQLGKAIAAADFKHESVTEFISDKVGLVASLTEKTQDLKKEYVAKCIQWEREEFQRRSEWLAEIRAIMYDENKYYSEAFFQKFGIEAEFKSLFHGSPAHWHAKSGWNNEKRFYAAKNKVAQIDTYIHLGLDYQLKIAENDAINHYENSVIKLARRLNDKGITEKHEYTITSERIGRNFECYIQSGDVFVKAWTIIAAEDSILVRPHYRYLVK